MESSDSDSLNDSTICAWGMFVDTLICGLDVIGEGEALALVAPPDSDGWRSQLVLRADRGRDLVWVTRAVEGGTAAEEVLAQAGQGGYFEVAEAIGRAAREELRLPHPQLFTARASGPGAARLAEELGLGVRAEVAGGGPGDLRPLAAGVVREVFGVDPDVDDDGDLVFPVDGTTTFLMFNGDQSLIQAWARVVCGVYSRRNTAVELGLLNRKAAWSTWYMNGRDVFLRNTLPARPFAADNLDGVLRNFALELRDNRDELAYRLGGTPA